MVPYMAVILGFLTALTRHLSLLHLGSWTSASPLFTAPSNSTLPSPGFPLIINTWGGDFTAATKAGYAALLNQDATALDGVQAACSACEHLGCGTTVGAGGSPDEACETTLDALIMDGTGSMRSGAVAGLRRVRDAVAVARYVLEHTTHSMLVGDLATRFAVENGFVEENLTSATSAAACRSWRSAACQPNYRLSVSPDPSASCGPYSPLPRRSGAQWSQRQQTSHDTIAVVAIDSYGRVAAGASTNGATHKVPGRVGDAPIAGAGAYADAEAGACGATGDGDVMVRFLPCYQAVENLRRGMDPGPAAEDAVRRMLRRSPGLASGLVVVDKQGRHGAAASGWTFTYSFFGGGMSAPKVITILPLDHDESRHHNQDNQNAL